MTPRTASHTSWRELEGFLLEVAEYAHLETRLGGSMTLLRPGARVTAFRPLDNGGDGYRPCEKVASWILWKPEHADEAWLEPGLPGLVEAARSRPSHEARPPGQRGPGLYAVDGGRTLVYLPFEAPPSCSVDVDAIDLATGGVSRKVRHEVDELRTAGESATRGMFEGMDEETAWRQLDRFRGCLLGGAIGDAFGTRLKREKKTDTRPKGRFDALRGILGGGGATVSYHTLLAMFTTEGLIRAWVRGEERGICNPAAVLWSAYRRWVSVQSRGLEPTAADEAGWLLGVAGSRGWRHCPASLRQSLQADPPMDVERAIGWNRLRRASVLTRVAPAGLVGSHDPWLSTFAALTDAHPAALDAVFCLAALLSRLVEGDSLEQAAQAAYERVQERSPDRGCARRVRDAIALARAEGSTSDAIRSLGSGRYAEEALAIAIYCGLRAGRLEDAVKMAATHSDGVSTTSLTGSIVGTWLGKSAVKDHLGGLELAAVVDLLATDLFHYVVGGPGRRWLAGGDWWKYPGC